MSIQLLKYDFYHDIKSDHYEILDAQNFYSYDVYFKFVCHLQNTP